MAFRPKIKNKDGSLVDLPLEAEQAVKLKNSRSIGLSGVECIPQSFNGTSAIKIPITGIPATLLTGTASIDTTGNASTSDKATKLTNAWTEYEKDYRLPHGAYLIKAIIADNTSGIGNHGTTITDMLWVDYTDDNEFIYRSYQNQKGSIHYYIANNYEAPLCKACCIGTKSITSNGFTLTVYVSPQGAYSSSSNSPKALALYPTEDGSRVSNFDYKIYYKKII